MSTLKLLIVEDNEEDLNTCRATVKRYQVEKNRQIDFVESRDLDDALNKINSSFDGAIIDLKLDKSGDEGNQVIRKIHSDYRIPLAVLTGTPQNAEGNIGYLGIYKKGETGYDELLDSFFEVFDTGLTKILGGRGLIEQTMNTVFWKNIIPQLEVWKKHVVNGKQTEQALLRFTVNHLLEILDDHSDIFFPEEMYICPPVWDEIRTGGIVKEKVATKYHIILSPACDLATHKGNMKTDRILVCLVEDRNMNLIKEAKKKINDTVSEEDDEVITDKKLRNGNVSRDFLNRLVQNNYANYYHYLPPTKQFKGGVINFRKVSTFKPSNFSKNFEKPFIQVSAAFTKDIVARFSSYYARQGQPGFDFNVLFEDLVGEEDG